MRAKNSICLSYLLDLFDDTIRLSATFFIRTTNAFFLMPNLVNMRSFIIPSHGDGIHENVGLKFAYYYFQGKKLAPRRTFLCKSWHVCIPIFSRVCKRFLLNSA